MLSRIKISDVFSSSLPILEYKIEDLNGAWSRNWQVSPVFTQIPAGGGYKCFAKDSDGCIAEKVIDYEPKLEILSYGAYIHNAAIGISFSVNTPSESRIRWDISIAGEEYEPDMNDLRDMGWSNDFKIAHTRYLPMYYIGAIHHYWVSVRSKWGQRANVNGRYVITPETLDPIIRIVNTNYAFQKVDPSLVPFELNLIDPISISHKNTNDFYENVMGQSFDISKVAINNEIDFKITAIEALLSHTIN